MNQNHSITAAFRKGKKVILKETWEDSAKKGLRFHKGTQGEVVDGEITGGRIPVLMRFPHQPSMVAHFPLSILESA
ncbi:MAG: hypothetical protein UY03_C0002G0006 [Parcubacteria group bacterium GW2011_GWA2_47_64]|nr:MAG: hypothetical protein UY03_C0002G0006 [Parcubacteria group bacterium GW2011_GWA2_47_64]KKU96722.1 MAG: hypothetical protein UY29_C0007G0008 [Parcubacteria group bacterium GW2011_GWC2_48_17]